MPAAWDRQSLESAGFVGFVPFSEIRGSAPPERPGVYVVLRSAVDEPVFLERSLGTGKAGRSYSVDDLRGRWLTTTPVVYIGKADRLGDRLRAYASKGGSHSGGRSVWQLLDQDELLVAWVETPGRVSKEVEVEARAAFAAMHGRIPFANRNR